jgi:hypothetical protein
MGQVKTHFGPFGDSVNLDQDRCMVAPNGPWAWKSFWAHPNGKHVVRVGVRVRLSGGLGGHENIRIT